MSEYILTHKHHTHPHAASGWRIHCGVEVTELSTNKQHTLSPDSRGFIDAYRLLNDAIVDDCKGFCEDPVNKMVEGIDYERARGRFKASFRAISHFMMTRANDSGVIFRDRGLQMAMTFHQFCKDLCDFDARAFKEGRA
jgi:hypothetical protein